MMEELSLEAKKLFKLLLERCIESKQLFSMWDIRGWKNPKRPVHPKEIANLQTLMMELEEHGIIRRKILPSGSDQKKHEYFLYRKR